MRKLFQGKYAILGLLVAILSGCSSWHHVSIFSHSAEPVEESPDSSPASVVNAPAVSVPQPEPSVPIVSQPQISEIPPATNDISSQTANPSLLPSTLEDVFFDYDQYYIRSEAVPILMQNAEILLNRHATRTVLIEGHCDERGTEEYNLILGERRAMAVKNYLVDLGVNASSIRILSLGKNEPFCLQPTRECFQKNRRAHFVLK
ncbi:OmpA family protein [Candidatus Nitrospira neomarina]|uniref:Peptidoglycan-associated lipoprotein n=1 Tax=Candidatus Nitrospira neomarina TaxID=3020899 RepID=A0AA96GKC8_9BACT|nr:OmpA family protein [Candidatus Nitrospira neomarina]WNM62888.1 OmpA family protein [Candidatus Nitrospira neomarina]